MVLKYFLPKYFAMRFFMQICTRVIYLWIFQIPKIPDIWALILELWELYRRMINAIWLKICWRFYRVIINVLHNCILIPAGCLHIRGLMNLNQPFVQCVS